MVSKEFELLRIGTALRDIQLIHEQAKYNHLLLSKKIKISSPLVASFHRIMDLVVFNPYLHSKLYYPQMIYEQSTVSYTLESQFMEKLFLKHQLAHELCHIDYPSYVLSLQDAWIHSLEKQQPRLLIPSLATHLRFLKTYYERLLHIPSVSYQEILSYLMTPPNILLPYHPFSFASGKLSHFVLSFARKPLELKTSWYASLNKEMEIELFQFLADTIFLETLHQIVRVQMNEDPSTLFLHATYPTILVQLNEKSSFSKHLVELLEYFGEILDFLFTTAYLMAHTSQFSLKKEQLKTYFSLLPYISDEFIHLVASKACSLQHVNQKHLKEYILELKQLFLQFHKNPLSTFITHPLQRFLIHSIEIELEQEWINEELSATDLFSYFKELSVHYFGKKAIQPVDTIFHLNHLLNEEIGLPFLKNFTFLQLFHPNHQINTSFSTLMIHLETHRFDEWYRHLFSLHMEIDERSLVQNTILFFAKRYEECQKNKKRTKKLC